MIALGHHSYIFDNYEVFNGDKTKIYKAGGSPKFDLLIAIISSIIAISGILLAYALYVKEKNISIQKNLSKRVIYKVLSNKSVNVFLKYLESTKGNILDFPDGKYNYDEYLANISMEFNYSFEYQNLNKIEKEIKKLDNKFKLPPVLKPYIKFCGLKYEGYSIAEDYNGIVQLLFSGRYNEIEIYPMKKLKPFSC